jgi:hypothetical protein
MHFPKHKQSLQQQTKKQTKEVENKKKIQIKPKTNKMKHKINKNGSMQQERSLN